MYTLGLEGGVPSQRMHFDKVHRKVDEILSEVPEHTETIALGNRERDSAGPSIRASILTGAEEPSILSDLQYLRHPLMARTRIE